MQLAKRVWDYSTSQDLLRDGDLVVVGVSGGPDSLCLLDVLHRLAPKHQLRLVVAHLNHSLRPEAEAEADFVQAEAERRGATYLSETADVAAVAISHKQSIETSARELRYAFFKRVAVQTDARLVAVAHTADDQAETVLMHLLRGAGLRGLRGMVPKRPMGEFVPLCLIRPLLAITRSEVVAYCAQRQLTPLTDLSNTDERYFRNRLRHELLPVLEAYNPNIRAVLARTAAAAAGDYTIWLGAVQDLWTATVVSPASDDRLVAFDRDRWLALTASQQRALLRMALEQLAGNGDGVEYVPLEAAVQFSRIAGPGRSCQIAHGIVLRVAGARIIVAPTQSNGVAQLASGPKVIDGALAPGWRLQSEHLEAGDWSPQEIASAPRWTAYVDTERLQPPIRLRARRPGDRFQPLGLDGHAIKISDFLVNQKIPVHQRAQWPLLTCADEIVWVMGLRLDERYKVTASTRRVTRLSLVPDLDE